jgi:hypothetical protein
MMQLRFGLLLTLLGLTSSTFAQDPCYNTDPMTVVVPEAVEALEAMKQRLLPAMSLAEAHIVKAVTICSAVSPALLGIKNVGALLPTDSAPIIVFGFDAFMAIKEVGRAITIARTPGVHSSYFEGYLRYRSSINRFKETPMSAIEFAVRLGAPGTEARIDSMPESEVIQGSELGSQLALFVVAHELAHHVLGHVHSKRPPDVQRQAEAMADLWAVRKLIQVGVDPTVATAFMLILNETESKSKFAQSISLHPPAFRRALHIVTETDRLVRASPEWIDSSMTAATTIPRIYSDKVRAYLARIEKLHALYARVVADETRLNEDNDFLLKTAQEGSTKSRIALASYYGTGKRKGLPKDWDSARNWMLLAANASAPYEHDYRADAYFYVGTLNLATGGNKDLGCESLRKAAVVNHLLATAYLTRMVTAGSC